MSGAHLMGLASWDGSAEPPQPEVPGGGPAADVAPVGGAPASCFAACGLLAPAARVWRLVPGSRAWRVKQRAEQRGEVALLRLLRERQGLTAVGVCWAWDGHELGLLASCVLAPGEAEGGLSGGLSDGAAKGPWLCERPDPVPRSHAPSSVQTQVLFAGLD